MQLENDQKNVNLGISSPYPEKSHFWGGVVGFVDGLYLDTTSKGLAMGTI